jgi:hypothetical protein
LWVLCLGLTSSLRQLLAQVLLSQDWPAVLSFACGGPEQLLDQGHIWLSLIRNLSSVLSGEACVMLDSIVLAQFCEIKFVGPIRAAKEVGRKLGHEEAKRWREVEGLSHGGIQVAECDVLAVMWKDAMVSPEKKSDTCWR